MRLRRGPIGASVPTGRPRAIVDGALSGLLRFPRRDCVGRVLKRLVARQHPGHAHRRDDGRLEHRDQVRRPAMARTAGPQRDERPQHDPRKAVRDNSTDPDDRVRSAVGRRGAEGSQQRDRDNRARRTEDGQRQPRHAPRPCATRVSRARASVTPVK